MLYQVETAGSRCCGGLNSPRGAAGVLGVSAELGVMERGAVNTRAAEGICWRVVEMGVLDSLGKGSGGTESGGASGVVVARVGVIE